MEQQAEKCVDCGKGIRPCDNFSGTYYGKSACGDPCYSFTHKWVLILHFPVISRGRKIHEECR